MTPGTRDRISSRPNPLDERISGAVTFVIASGVVRVAEAFRVADTVTFGNVVTVSRAGARWATRGLAASPRPPRTATLLTIRRGMRRGGKSQGRAVGPATVGSLNTLRTGSALGQSDSLRPPYQV